VIGEGKRRVLTGGKESTRLSISFSKVSRPRWKGRLKGNQEKEKGFVRDRATCRVLGPEKMSPGPRRPRSELEVIGFGTSRRGKKEHVTVVCANGESPW